MNRIIVFLFGALVFIFYVKELVKEIKTWSEIKPSINDNLIDAIVIEHIPCMHGDVKPILVYRDNSIERNYIFHFYCNPKQYTIGEKKLLNYSLKSGLAYNRKDLLKSFFYNLLGICFGSAAIVVVVWSFFVRYNN